MNFGTIVAAMWIVSPVRGCTPWRAPRSATRNLPKPEKVDVAAARQRLLMRLEHGVDGLPASFLPRLRPSRDLVDEL